MIFDSIIAMVLLLLPLLGFSAFLPIPTASEKCPEGLLEKVEAAKGADMETGVSTCNSDALSHSDDASFHYMVKGHNDKLEMIIAHPKKDPKLGKAQYLIFGRLFPDIWKPKQSRFKRGLPKENTNGRDGSGQRWNIFKTLPGDHRPSSPRAGNTFPARVHDTSESSEEESIESGDSGTSGLMDRMQTSPHLPQSHRLRSPSFAAAGRNQGSEEQSNESEDSINSRDETTFPPPPPPIFPFRSRQKHTTTFPPFPPPTFPWPRTERQAPFRVDGSGRKWWMITKNGIRPSKGFGGTGAFLEVQESPRGTRNGDRRNRGNEKGVATNRYDKEGRRWWIITKNGARPNPDKKSSWKPFRLMINPKSESPLTGKVWYLFRREPSGGRVKEPSHFQRIPGSPPRQPKGKDTRSAFFESSDVDLDYGNMPWPIPKRIRRIGSSVKVAPNRYDEKGRRWWIITKNGVRPNL